MYIHIKRVTCDGYSLCFNHAVLASLKGIPISEILSSSHFDSCDWCEFGVPLEIQNKDLNENSKFIKHHNGLCWTTKCLICGKLTNPGELIYTEIKTGAAICKECVGTKNKE